MPIDTPRCEHLQANAWLRSEMAAVPSAELGCIHDQEPRPRITILAREELLQEKS
jgi:hypothetical protein